MTRLISGFRRWRRRNLPYGLTRIRPGSAYAYVTGRPMSMSQATALREEFRARTGADLVIICDADVRLADSEPLPRRGRR